MSENETWLSNWAADVQYTSTDDLLRKIFNEIIMKNVFKDSKVEYGDNGDPDTITITVTTLTEEFSFTVPKK